MIASQLRRKRRHESFQPLHLPFFPGFGLSELIKESVQGSEEVRVYLEILGGV
jgi:hypothetical protein